MSQTGDSIRAMRKRLTDPHRWVKGQLMDEQLGEHRTMCLLGARLDELTDGVALSDLEVGPWPVQSPAWFNECGMSDLVINRDPVNKLVCEVIIEQFNDRVDALDEEEYGKPYHVIPTFNDHADTAHYEVLAVLDKAALRADELLD